MSTTKFLGATPSEMMATRFEGLFARMGAHNAVHAEGGHTYMFEFKRCLKARSVAFEYAGGDKCNIQFGHGLLNTKGVVKNLPPLHSINGVEMDFLPEQIEDFTGLTLTE